MNWIGWDFVISFYFHFFLVFFFFWVGGRLNIQQIYIKLRPYRGYTVYTERILVCVACVCVNIVIQILK